MKNSSRAMLRWATAVTVLAVFLWIALNLCASVAGDRFGLSLDWTDSRLYELSGETREVLGELAAPVTVTVLSTESDYPALYRELLSRIALCSDRITLNYIDPSDNPLLLSHYEQMGMSLNADDLLVEGSARSVPVAYADTLVEENSRLVGIDLEQLVVSAILYANNPNAPTAALTTGHGERATDALSKLLTDNGFTVSNAALGVDGLENPSLLVIAGPAYDFSQTETALVSAYLAGGGKLMIFLDPGLTDCPNLTALLETWGVTPDADLVFEPSAHVSDTLSSVIPMYASHAINTYFASHPVYTVLPQSRSLTLNRSLGRVADAQALLVSTGDSYAKSDMAYLSSAHAAGDMPGPFTLAAYAEAEDGGAVFAAGSRLMIADDVMGMSAYANRLFLAQVLGALSPDTTAVSIPVKAIDDTTLAVTARQSLTIGLVLAVALPLLVLAAGVGVSLRRRRL